MSKNGVGEQRTKLEGSINQAKVTGLGIEEANNRHTTQMHTRTGKHDVARCADFNSQDPNRQDLRCQAPSGHDLMRQGLSGDALSGSVPSGDALNGVDHRRVVVSQGSVVNNLGSEQVSQGDQGGRQPWHEVEAKSEIGQVQFDETLPAAAHSRIKCFQVSPHSSY